MDKSKIGVRPNNWTLSQINDDQLSNDFEAERSFVEKVFGLAFYRSAGVQKQAGLITPKSFSSTGSSLIRLLAFFSNARDR